MFCMKLLGMYSSTEEIVGLDANSLNAKQSGEELLDEIVVLVDVFMRTNG